MAVPWSVTTSSTGVRPCSCSQATAVSSSRPPIPVPRTERSVKSTSTMPSPAVSSTPSASRKARSTSPRGRPTPTWPTTRPSRTATQARSCPSRTMNCSTGKGSGQRIGYDDVGCCSPSERTSAGRSPGVRGRTTGEGSTAPSTAPSCPSWPAGRASLGVGTPRIDASGTADLMFFSLPRQPAERPGRSNSRTRGIRLRPPAAGLAGRSVGVPGGGCSPAECRAAPRS